jgi:predicted nucleic acid-binding protein
MIIVSDAGPLIALAKTGYLSILRELFGKVVIPSAVADELCLGDNRPGAIALAQAIYEEAWIAVESVRIDKHKLATILDPGETQAIVLAGEKNAVLLIDERRGRMAAARQGLTIIGTGRILVAAKAHRLIPSVAEALKNLTVAGYRLSPALCDKLLELASET